MRRSRTILPLLAVLATLSIAVAAHPWSVVLILGGIYLGAELERGSRKLRRYAPRRRNYRHLRQYAPRPKSWTQHIDHETGEVTYR